MSRTVAYSDISASCMGSASIPCNLLERHGSGGGGRGGILIVRRCHGAVVFSVLFDGVTVLLDGKTVLLDGKTVLLDGKTVLFI